MIPKRSAVFVILVLTSLYYIYFLQSFFSPSPPITTTTIATPSNPSNQTTSNPTFSPTNLALTHSECLTHFPSLFTPLDKTASFFTKNPPLTRTYFDSLFTLRHSPHQNDAFQLLAALKNGSLYIKEYRSHHGNAARAKLLLDQLYQAVIQSPDPLPDIEFAVNIEDRGAEGVDGVWVMSRRVGKEGGWLVPDFGFQAWPEVGVLSYRELRNEIRRVEESGGEKVGKVLWRGAPMAIVNREHALTYSGEDWADIKELRWSCMKTPTSPECINLTDHKTITDHCKYKYLLQTEGHAYSGRLKYLLNCKSVVIADKLEWDQHFHHLLDYDPASPQQNMVLVPSPFKENLPRVMKELLANPEKAKTIAENAWDDLRNRYLAPAANACYWRYLVKRYAETMQFEVDLQLRELIPGQKRVGAAGTGMAAPYESFVFMGTTDWVLA